MLRAQVSDMAPITSVLSKCKSLTSLDVSWNSFNAQAGTALGIALPAAKSLRRLLLQFNPIGDSGAAAILRVCCCCLLFVVVVVLCFVSGFGVTSNALCLALPRHAPQSRAQRSSRGHQSVRRLFQASGGKSRPCCRRT